MSLASLGFTRGGDMNEETLHCGMTLENPDVPVFKSTFQIA